jgi:hypothetical protein
MGVHLAPFSPHPESHNWIGQWLIAFRSLKKVAVTARLIVRFLLPVPIDQPAVVKAWIREYEPTLYILEAEREQNGQKLVRGSAKFIDRDLV